MTTNEAWKMKCTRKITERNSGREEIRQRIELFRRTEGHRILTGLQRRNG